MFRRLCGAVGLLLSFSAFGVAQNNYVTGSVSANQIVNGPLNISLIPTTGVSATKLNGTDISTLTGLLKLTSGTPSNAAAADVVGLFSNCNSSTPIPNFNTLACVSAGGTGTVTSVGLGAPTAIFTISGSPVTGSGTLTLSWATGQTANQVYATNSSGAAGLIALTSAHIPPINLASTTNGGVTGSLPNASVAGLAASAITDTTSATNITSGTLAAARVAAINLGGTGNGGVTGSLPNASVAGLAASATTDTTNAANITSGSLPVGRIPTSVQVWNKYSIPYTSVQTASTSNAVTVVALTAKQLVCGVIEKTTTAFAGTSITGLVNTVGDSNGSSTTYSAAAYNDLATVSNTNFIANNVTGLASFAGGNVQANFTATGANLSALTAGSLDVTLCTVTLP